MWETKKVFLNDSFPKHILFIGNPVQTMLLTNIWLIGKLTTISEFTTQLAQELSN